MMLFSKQSVLSYFRFSNGEIRGSLILALLIVIVSCFPSLLRVTLYGRISGADPELILKAESFTAKSEINGSLSSTVHNQNTEFSKIELNSADTSDLIILRGIGPVLSRRILRYKDLLGGYALESQLLEVYGIDSSLYKNILPYVIVDTSFIVKLDINKSGFGELLRHPYLEYEMVLYLFELRNSGVDVRMEHLEESKLFNKVDLSKLGLYLNF